MDDSGRNLLIGALVLLVALLAYALIRSYSASEQPLVRPETTQPMTPKS